MNEVCAAFARIIEGHKAHTSLNKLSVGRCELTVQRRKCAVADELRLVFVGLIIVYNGQIVFDYFKRQSVRMCKSIISVRFVEQTHFGGYARI